MLSCSDTELRLNRFADYVQILCRINEENRRLTGGQSRFDEAETAEKMPPDASVLGAKQYEDLKLKNSGRGC